MQSYRRGGEDPAINLPEFESRFNVGYYLCGFGQVPFTFFSKPQFSHLGKRGGGN